MRSSDSVLVTGATGFVGRCLLERLRESGARVTGISRNPPASGGADHRACDLEDEAAVQRLFDEIRPSHVIHLASLVTGSRDLNAVVPTFRANLAAAVHLLAAAARIGSQRARQVRFEQRLSLLCSRWSCSSNRLLPQSVDQATR